MFWMFVLAFFLGTISGALVIITVACMMSGSMSSKEEDCYCKKGDTNGKYEG